MSFNKNVWQGSKFEQKLKEADVYRLMGDTISRIQYYTPVAGKTSTIQIIYSLDTSSSKNVTSSITNWDLSKVLPTDAINAVGVLLSIYTEIYMDGVKTQASTLALVNAYYSDDYNITPPTANYLCSYYLSWPASDADNVTMDYGFSDYCVCPIVYSGKNPYITWNANLNYSGMTTVSGQYYANVRLRPLAFMI